MYVFFLYFLFLKKALNERNLTFTLKTVLFFFNYLPYSNKDKYKQITLVHRYEYYSLF